MLEHQAAPKLPDWGLLLSVRVLPSMQGSDAELEEETVKAHRGRCVLLAQQPRQAFHQTTNLSDKDSSELWNSSQMECRPFKDPTYDLRRMEQDIGIQAVPVTQDLAIQATPARVSLLLAAQPANGIQSLVHA